MFSEETNSAERRSTKSGDDRFRRYSDSAHMNNDSNKGLQFRKYSAGSNQNLRHIKDDRKLV